MGSDGVGSAARGQGDGPFLCDDFAEAVDHAVVVFCAGNGFADLELHARLDLRACVRRRREVSGRGSESESESSSGRRMRMDTHDI